MQKIQLYRHFLTYACLFWYYNATKFFVDLLICFYGLPHWNQVASPNHAQPLSKCPTVMLSFSCKESPVNSLTKQPSHKWGSPCILYIQYQNTKQEFRLFPAEWEVNQRLETWFSIDRYWSAYCTMGCLCGPHLLNTLKWIWNHLFLAGIDHVDWYTHMFKNCEPAALEGHQSWINPKPSVPPLRHWSWLRSMAWARTLFVAASDRILFDMKRWI